MKLRNGALLAAAGVLALAGCQDEQALQDGDAPPPTSTSSRAEGAPPTEPNTNTEQPQVNSTSGSEPAPVVTRSTTSPRIAWSKEDLAQQLRAKIDVPPSTTVRCVEGLPARKDATTTCTVAADAGASLYAAHVEPAGTTGAMAPKFTQVSR